MPNRLSPEPPSPETCRVADETLVSVKNDARKALRILLSTLPGRRYEEPESEKARDTVWIVNHLAHIINAKLFLIQEIGILEDPVYLKCVTGKRQKRPFFQVCRLKGKKNTVYSGRAFPRLDFVKSGAK